MEVYVFENWLNNIIKRVDKAFKERRINYPPRLSKVVINACVSSAVSDKKNVDNMCRVLEEISGQKAIITRAKKSITSFKTREGMPIGCKVTLRGRSAFTFLYKLINVYLPLLFSTRNINGLSVKSFDISGSNYVIGIRDLSILHDLSVYGLMPRNQGMQIIINLSSNNLNDSKLFFECFNFPIISPTIN